MSRPGSLPDKALRLTPNSALLSICGIALAAGNTPHRWQSALLRAAEAPIRWVASDKMWLRTLFVAFVLVLAGPTIAHRDGEPEGFSKRLVRAAVERTNHRVIYDGSYRPIPYPNGDVPRNVGVCTDLIIRAYRELGIDLQKDVHEEMEAHFEAFPANWGLRRPDPNIDHRRVLNLQTFFTRKGIVLPVTGEAEDYVAGDLVTWIVAGNYPHIGIVTEKRSADGKRPLIVHNIGRGPRVEDVLFSYPITGHYRYYGSR